MAILSGPEIERLVREAKGDKARWGTTLPPSIDITPFEPKHMGPNSVDVTLMPVLEVVTLNGCRRIDIPADGFELQPGYLYLGSTNEVIEAHGLVPVIETRSSFARLGLSTHLSAGFCDDGFRGTITLEITVVLPVVVKPNVRVAQVAFHQLVGERRPYQGRYAGQVGPTPSRLHLTEGGE